MMRRYKENRQVIGRHRGQTKDRLKHSLDSKAPHREWEHLDADVLKQNSQNIQAKRKSDQRYYQRLLIIILCVALIGIFLLALFID